MTLNKRSVVVMPATLNILQQMGEQIKLARLRRQLSAELIAELNILQQMGEQIKLARLRRQLSAELIAERAGISRATLWNIEKGSPSVSIGAYAAVLHALGGMDRDLLMVAKDDELGRKLQDLDLLPKKRAPKQGGET